MSSRFYTSNSANIVNITREFGNIIFALKKKGNVSAQIENLYRVIEVINTLDKSVDYKFVLDAYNKSDLSSQSDFIDALQAYIEVIAPNDAATKAELMLFEQSCKILDILEKHYPYTLCKKYIEHTLPKEFGAKCNWETIVDVFAKAMVQGLLEKAEHKNGKGLKRTRKMNKVLFAYLCGRIFCEDFISHERNPPAWGSNGCQALPDKLITIYFGEKRLGHTRDKQINERDGKFPQGYKIVEALLAEPNE